jgi:DNA-binding NarL/FixJ family response regulator
MIRVVIADDHPEMRLALRILLRLSQDAELVGEASNGVEAVDFVQRLRPDLLIMDIRMPVMDGLEATRQIGSANIATKVILISSDRGARMVSQSIDAGAHGFVPKEELLSLTLAMRAIQQGETFFIA